MSVGREMTSVGMSGLQLGGHDTLVGTQEVRVDIAAEVFDRAGRRVEWNEIGEDPADRTQAEPQRQVIHRFTGILHQLHRVLGADLHKRTGQVINNNYNMTFSPLLHTPSFPVPSLHLF